MTQLGRLVAGIAIVVGGAAGTGSAQTQTEAVVSWEWEFWAAGVVPGVGAPLSVQTFTKASALCDRPKSATPTGTVVNPSILAIDDPLLPLRECVMSQTTASGTLQSLPLGTGMRATARARGATTLGVRSAESNPFSRAVVLVAPPGPSGVLVLP